MTRTPPVSSATDFIVADGIILPRAMRCPCPDPEESPIALEAQLTPERMAASASCGADSAAAAEGGGNKVMSK